MEPSVNESPRIDHIRRRERLQLSSKKLQTIVLWRDLPKCADWKTAVFSGILEAVVTNPPHIMNIISDFITSHGFTVTFNDNIAFA